MLAVPLAWAVLLLFHPAPDADDIHGSLHDVATGWLVVHLGSVLFVGLFGAALYLLVRDLPGNAARVSRLAIGPFVLFYGAGEAILGVATGVLVQHANDVPADERAAAAGAAQALWDNFIAADLIIGIGSVALVVAVIAAAVAYRGVGASLTVSILLGLTAIAVVHTPPFGQIGLLSFAAAEALLARSQSATTAADTARQALTDHP